jgi:preprotein translocase subunit SecG
MIHTILNVIYVLIAVSIVAFILLQRGAGAQAGSGFGGGASSTVFGSRGSSNFLTSATKWLAVTFFALSLYMAWQAARDARVGATPADTTDIGVMGDLPAAPPAATPAPSSTLPAAPAAPATVPAPTTDPVIAPATPAPAAGAAPAGTEPAPPETGEGG